MKNTVTYFLLLPFTCSLSLIACYSPRYVYSPTATNVPAFSKKGDSKLAAYYSNSAFSGRDVKKYYGYGFDAQFACAVHDNWLVLLNQSNRYEKNSGNLATDNTGSNFIRYKRSMTEIGGGFFRVVKDSSKLFVQLTGGIGVGKFLLDDNGKDAANQLL